MDQRSKVKLRAKASDPSGLHKAKSGEKVLDCLSQEGVDPRACDENGDTPLHAYIRSNKIDCLFAFLINAEYNIDILNKDDDTPLHLACKMKIFNCVKALVAFDADLNIFNDNIMTPLDIAKNGNCKEIVQLLEDVGGLTNMAILDPESNFKPVMDKEVMDMNNVEEIRSGCGGGATDLILGGGGAKENGGGTNLVELPSKLQDVKASGMEGIGYQSHKKDEETDHYFPKQILSIPEEDEEEIQTPDVSVLGAITHIVWPENPKHEENTPLEKPENCDNVLKIGATTEAPEKVRKRYDGQNFERLVGMQKEDNKEQACYKEKTRSRPQAEALSGNKPEEATDFPDVGSEKPLFTFSTIKPGRVGEFEGRQHHHPRQFSPKRVHYVGPGESIRHLRLRGSKAALENSLLETKSLLNPKMSVIQSELGISSVMPEQMKTLKKGQGGHRILCLDGGGIKGVIEIEILRAIERLSGCAIPELFDWIVGTSIGGILTLGMVYGNKTCSDLHKVCFKMKDLVFKRKSWLKYSCDTKALENLLIDILGKETKMTEKREPKVMITAVNKEDTSLPLVFFNNCFDDEYSDALVWQVARCTSAAPVYFKSCENYIDGGLVANNPCNHSLSRIRMFLRNQQDKDDKKMTNSTDIRCLVSLGCGDFPPKSIGNCDIEDLDFTKIFHAKERIKNVIQTFIACIGRSEDDAQICRFFCEEMDISFHRFNPKVSVEVGITETDNLKICDCIISAKKMVHRDEAHLEEVVKNLGKDPIPLIRVHTLT